MELNIFFITKKRVAAERLKKFYFKIKNQVLQEETITQFVYLLQSTFRICILK